MYIFKIYTSSVCLSRFDLLTLAFGGATPVIIRFLPMQSWLSASWEILVELAPWLLLGCGVAGILHVFCRRGRWVNSLASQAWPARRGPRLLACRCRCGCSVIPTGLGLQKDGASKGASLSFIISTPQTGVDSIFVSAAMLGWPLTLFKVVIAFIMGCLGGSLLDRRQSTATELPQATGSETKPLAAGQSETEPTASCCSVSGCGGEVADGSGGLVTEEGAATPSLRRRFVQVWTFAIDDLLRMIWRWLAIGVLVSAALTVLFAEYSWQLDSLPYALQIFGALVISIPMYMCAVASVPIAATLVSAGLPTGAALVLLIAGPATNVATIAAIARGLGRRAVVIYLAVLIVGSLIGAFVYDQFFPSFLPEVTEYPPVEAPAGEHHKHGEPWWAVTSAVIVAALFVRFAVQEMVHFLPDAAVNRRRKTCCGS